MNSVEYLEFNVSARHRVSELSDDALISLVQSKILPVVERVLEELGEPNRGIEIDNLKLDLGDVTRHDFQVNLGGIVYKQLRALVLEHVSHAKAIHAPESNWLQKIFSSKSMSSAAQLWEVFSKDLPGKYRGQLQELLVLQDNRRFVARLMSDPMVFDIIKALEPMNAAFIILMIQQYTTLNAFDDPRKSYDAESGFGSKRESENIQADKIKKVKKQNVTDVVLRQQMIEFSLSYLVCDRGGQFNKRSYLRSVLQKLASHNNQSVTVLCEQIRQSLNSVAGNHQGIKRELLAVVSMELGSSYSQSELTENRIKFDIREDWVLDLKLLAGKDFDGRVTTQQLIAIFDSALNTNKQILCRMLLKRRDDKAFMSFVCSILPEAIIYRILAEISAGQFKSICQYADVLKLTLCSAGFLNDDTSLKALFWPTTLMFTLQQSSSNSDIRFLKGLSNKVISAIKINFNASDMEIIERLSLFSSKQSENTQRVRDLRIVLQELADVMRTSSNTPAFFDQREEHDVKALAWSGYNDKPRSQVDWLDQVVNAIAQGSWGFSEQLWCELKAESSGLLKSKLRRALLRQTSRALFISRLNMSQQLEVIHLLSVDGFEIVKPVWADDIVLSPPSQPSAKSNRCGVVLKDFTLGYLVHDRGSEFNRKSFARGLLKQLAAHYNLSYCELLDNLLENTNVGGLSLGVKTILSEILDIDTFSQTQTQTQTPESEIEEDRPEQGTALYYRLVDILNSQTVITKDIWSNVLQRLATHYPALLVRFVRELQRGIWDLSFITKKLTEPSIQLLLDKILFVTGHQNANDGSGLALAIKRFASRSTAPVGFYLESMQVVLAGGVIDLEQVERRAKSHSVPAELNRTRDFKRTDSERMDFEKSAGCAADNRDVASNSIASYSEASHSVGKNGYQATPSHGHAVSTLIDAARSEQGLARFMQLSENQQFSYYMAADPKKTRILWRYITFLRNALLGSDLKFSYTLFNRWVCQSLVEQLLWPKLPPSVDRCIQKHLSGLFEHIKTTNNIHNWSILQPQLIAHLFSVSTLSNTSLGGQTAEKLRKLLASYSEIDINAHSTKFIPSTEVIDSKKMHIPTHAEERLKANEIDSLKTDSSKSNALELKAPESTADLPNTEGGIAVNNAGIVAIAPYIPMLFEKLNLISSQAFTNEQSRLKAMAVLHYLAFAKPLYQSDTFVGCGLTKLLCGLDIDASISDSAVLDHDEQTLCDSLLQGVIGHWSALGKTTVDGLREIFFQREGIMTFDEEKGWLLQVNARSFDVLLDRIPWSYSTVKYQFMKNVIHVEWR